jgi:hypothetical protein
LFQHRRTVQHLQFSKQSGRLLRNEGISPMRRVSSRWDRGWRGEPDSTRVEGRSPEPATFSRFPRYGVDQGTLFP